MSTNAPPHTTVSQPQAGKQSSSPAGGVCRNVVDVKGIPRFSEEISACADALCQRLVARGMHIVTAESCTGGLLAVNLSRTSGSARCLVGSFVTYRPSMKISALGVSADLIAEQTVYDTEVSLQMAVGALKGAPEADIALAITGVAGPGPHQGKPAGLVFISVAVRGQTPEVHEYRFAGNADDILTEAMLMALELGIAAVEALDDCG